MSVYVQLHAAGCQLAVVDIPVYFQLQLTVVDIVSLCSAPAVVDIVSLCSAPAS